VHRLRSRTTALAAAAAALTAALALPSGAAAARDRDVTVMSRNLYLGADIIKAAGAPTPEAQAQAATEIFRIVRRTNFPLRARAIASEIDRTAPDLIGLQEVSLWRRTPDGVTNDVKDARRVVYDFLAILQRRLRARGLRYRVEVVQQEADFEVPTSEGYDLRLTMRDVILRRTGRRARVQVRRRLKGNYTTNLEVPIQGQTVTSLRGWTAVDARLRGRSFRFVNTHLEAFGAQIRADQAGELVAGPLAPASRPVILVGDLNSDPRDASADGLAFRRVADAGFVSAFDPFPATSGQSETLDNPVSTLRSFIDHILSRPRLRTVRSEVVGDEPQDRIGGLWPSDHAGVVATLRLPR
jgi:endonuclease/exonuclease/phosphatase family metal-dependent hydrolase